MEASREVNPNIVTGDEGSTGPVVPGVPYPKKSSTIINADASAEEVQYYSLQLEASRTHFQEIQAMNVLFLAGEDAQQRPIVVFIGANLPKDQEMQRKLLLYAVSALDEIVKREYVIVYCHTKMSWLSGSNFSFLRTIHSSLTRKYKKNIKGLYILHPSIMLKTFFTFAKPFLSRKFYRKLNYCTSIAQLCSAIGWTEAQAKSFLPPLVVSYDAEKAKPTPTAGSLSSSPPTVVPIEQGAAFPTPTQVFGVSLTLLADLRQERIPFTVLQLSTFLETKGLDEVGLFRIPAPSTALKECKAALDEGQSLNIIQDDVHLAAGLFKMFFAQLPEPLMLYSLYDDFSRAADIPDEETRVNVIRSLVLQFPAAHRDLLQFLLQFLSKVASHSDKNQMTARNLAVCFMPNLFRPRIMSLTDAKENYEKLISVLASMIVNQTTLFENLPEPRRRTSFEVRTVTLPTTPKAKSSGVDSGFDSLAPVPAVPVEDLLETEEVPTVLETDGQEETDITAVAESEQLISEELE